jgi:hypothetical protein
MITYSKNSRNAQSALGLATDSFFIRCFYLHSAQSALASLGFLFNIYGFGRAFTGKDKYAEGKLKRSISNIPHPSQTIVVVFHSRPRISLSVSLKEGYPGIKIIKFFF